MDSKILNIVLADDDEDDRMFFKEVIDKVGIHTKLSLFKNGQELMDYLMLPNIVLPSLIFLDLNMPIKNGMQSLTEIRAHERFKDIVVAIYSTSSSEQDIEDTFVKGANIYINKPSSFSKLTEVIEKVLNLNWQYFTNNLNKENFLYRI